MRTVRKLGNYGDLAAADGTPVVDSDDRITLAVPIGQAADGGAQLPGPEPSGREQDATGSSG
jgi:hypothetical protein